MFIEIFTLIFGQTSFQNTDTAVTDYIIRTAMLSKCKGGRVHVMGKSLALKAKSAKGSYYVHAATMISLFSMQLTC